jgi:hypothetical protein
MNTEFKQITYPDGSIGYEAVNIKELNALGAAATTATPIEFTQEQISEFALNQQKNQAREYLASTDWYAARLAETGTAIPTDVLEQRQAARELLSSQ